MSQRLYRFTVSQLSDEKPVELPINFSIHLNVAKVGGLQSQGVKGDAVVGYREALTTQDLESSGFHGEPLLRGPKGQQHGKIDPILRFDPQ